MRSGNSRLKTQPKLKARKTPLNASTDKASKSGKRTDSIVSRIISQFTTQSRANIEGWRAAIAQAENDRYPKRELWAKLVKELDLDAHWSAQIQIRKSLLMMRRMEVIDKVTKKEIPEKSALFQQPWFKELVSIALDAKFFGTQAVEIQDLMSGNKKANAVFRIPMANLIPERKQIVTKAGDNVGKFHGDDPFVFWFDEDIFLGLLCKAAPHIIWIRNAFQAWSEFIEKFGIPMRIAKTNKRDQGSIDKLERMLDELGSASRAIFPEGTTIDFKEVEAADAFEVFDRLIIRSSEMISKLVNGATMHSDSGSSRAQGEIHLRVVEMHIHADMMDIEAQVNWSIGQRLQSLGFEFNPDKEEFRFDKSQKIKLDEYWKIVYGMLDLGYNVEKEWLNKKFGMQFTERRDRPIP